MDVLYFVLLLLGLVCFLAHAFLTEPRTPRSLLGLGLAFWIAVPLIAQARVL